MNQRTAARISRAPVRTERQATGRTKGLTKPWRRRQTLPTSLTPHEKQMTLQALARSEMGQAVIVPGTAVLGKRARDEDRLWELSRIADALEERLRIIEERTRK